MSSLSDPLPLPCGLVLPNRIMKAAMSEALGGARNNPDERIERLYRTWAHGGYGLLVTGNVMIDRSQLAEPGNVVIEDERDLDALTSWAKSTKDSGVPIMVQLNHPGRQANPLSIGHTPVAPSAVPLNLPGAATPRALTAPEIEDIVASVTERRELDDAFSEIVERFGRVDVVVANAGVLSRAATLRTTTAEAFDAVMAVNVTGAFNTVQAALPHVIAQRGQVVLISSVFAYLNGIGAIPYAMSKAAIEQRGRGLQVELAIQDVTTTTAYFSLIDTPMVRAGVDADNMAGELMRALPRPLLKRLQPADADAALVDALQQRTPRVMVPARWKPLSAARGVIGPLLDKRLAHDRQIQASLTELDTR